MMTVALLSRPKQTDPKSFRSGWRECFQTENRDTERELRRGEQIAQTCVNACYHSLSVVMRLKSALLLVVTCFILLSGSVVATQPSTLPKNGVIPDEQTAVGVALVIFRPVYGDEEISKFQPYHAQLERDTWTVYGTLPRGSRGGTPQLRVRKRDGKVLDIWHSQ